MGFKKFGGVALLPSLATSMMVKVHFDITLPIFCFKLCPHNNQFMRKIFFGLETDLISEVGSGPV